MMGKLMISERTEGNMFKTAVMFPVDSFISLLVSDSEKKEMKVSRLKGEVLNYIRERKRASISEIMDKFSLTLDEAGLVFKKLKNEKQIIIKD